MMDNKHDTQVAYVQFKGLNNEGSDIWTKPGNLSLSGGCIAIGNELKALPSIPQAPTLSSYANQGNGPINPSTLEEYPEFPVIEFGLQRVGYIALPHPYIVPESMVPDEDGNPRQTCHTETTKMAERISASKIVMQDLQRAVRQQCEAKGLLFQPFLIRYVLRLSDGETILPSAPVLMLGNALAPCLKIESINQDVDDSVMSLSSGTLPIFQLRYRIHSLPASKWIHKISAIDIFISEPLATYDPENPSLNGATRYSHILMRGAEDPSTIIAGIYSDANDDYQVHTLEETGMASDLVWDIIPRNDLIAQISSANKFYRVASLPISMLQTSYYFQNLSIPNTGVEYLKALPLLNEDNLTHCTIKPAFAASIGGRVHAGGGSIVLPSPFPLQSCLARSTSLDNYDWVDTQVKVWLNVGDNYYSREINCTYQSLVSNFPPYLYYPHRGAYMMQITQGNYTWRLPLRPHDSLDGTYWMPNEFSIYGSNFSYTNPIEADGAECPCRNTLYSSLVDNRLRFPIVNIVGNGKLKGVAPALQSFSSGQWGQFPLYVFSSDGIWALVADAAGGLKVKQQLSQYEISSGAGICSIEDSVAFVAGKRIMMLEGSKFTTINEDISFNPVLPELPHSEELLPDYPKISEVSEAGGIISLVYDKEERILWALQGAMGWAYSLASGNWGQSWNGIEKMTILTRPLQIEENRAIRIRAIEILPPINGRLKWILYGSENLKDWEIVASGKNRQSDCIFGSRWRFYRLALQCEPQAVSGVKIVYQKE